MAGFAQGGGVGLALAQWMIEGEPQSDIFAMDVARFGSYATEPYARARAREFYAKRFQIAYPNEVWPAGRPSKTSAIHADLKAANAVFGVSYGTEVPLYFAAPGEAAREVPSLHRSNAFAQVGEECMAARGSLGLLDISPFAKYRVTGADAARALERLLAGRLPAEGQVRITPMLSPSGRLMGDLTTLRLATEEFLLFGSGYLQRWHMRWFDTHLAASGVKVENISDDYGGIGILGPKARTLLERVAEAEVSNEAMPFMTARRMAVGYAPAIVARLSVSGELGYEIYVPVALPALTESAARRDERRSRCTLGGSICAQRAATGEGLRHMVARIHARLHAANVGAEPLRRVRQERLHRTRGGSGRSRRHATAPARVPRDRRRGCGRNRIRADPRGRGAGGLRDLRRLRPLREEEPRHGVSGLPRAGSMPRSPSTSSASRAPQPCFNSR